MPRHGVDEDAPSFDGPIFSKSHNDHRSRANWLSEDDLHEPRRRNEYLRDRNLDRVRVSPVHNDSEKGEHQQRVTAKDKEKGKTKLQEKSNTDHKARQASRTDAEGADLRWDTEFSRLTIHGDRYSERVPEEEEVARRHQRQEYHQDVKSLLPHWLGTAYPQGYGGVWAVQASGVVSMHGHARLGLALVEDS